MPRLLLLATAFASVLLPPSAHAQLTTESLAGLTPRNIGPATMSGRVVDLAVVEMDTRVFYVASATEA